MNILVYKDGQQLGPFNSLDFRYHALMGEFNETTDYAWY
jgi:hypothetical protein